jgi:RNA polymerase subunit RPABC4/transcription elongation factor Spt4
MKTEHSKQYHQTTFIKCCHHCNTLMETHKEPERCSSCKRPFLPLNYFSKVHAKNSEEFKELFCDAADLTEKDLIKGLTVIW